MLSRTPRPAVPKLLLAIPAVLALLALVLLPAIARAESSAGIVYPLAGAGVTSTGPLKLGRVKAKPGPHRAKAGHRAKAHSHSQPANGGGGTGETADEPEGEPESEGTHRARVTPAGNGDSHLPGGKGTSPKSSPGTGSQPRTNVSAQREVATPKRVDAAGNGGGGSSPVAPILIAVAVLAALSVGVVLYRERRGGGDGPGRLGPPA